MKYYIIAGEASGDLHGSNLIREIMKKDPAAIIRAWGGRKMEEAGAEIVKDYRELAFMGFAEVLKNLPAILRNLRFCKEDITGFAPDVLVLIDYPGFNMRIAKWAKPRGYKVAWYISPQIWAWKENRVHALKRDTDKMIVILPFEKPFYKEHGMEVIYAGHPLADHINQWRKNNPGERDTKLIAVLPGSREQEIKVKLPLMLSAAKFFPGYRFVVAQTTAVDPDIYRSIMLSYENVEAVTDATYQLLSKAAAALVTSGTATLETALFEVPEVICYKGSALSFAIAKRLIKIKFIGLVNLIMNRKVVKELIQHDLTTENIVGALDEILHSPEKRSRITHDYMLLSELLQSGGNASENTAKEIVHLARQ